MDMTKREVALIEAKVDLFEKWYAEEIGIARKCADVAEANEHYVEAMKCSSSACALRNILVELGF